MTHAGKSQSRASVFKNNHYTPTEAEAEHRIDAQEFAKLEDYLKGDAK